MKTQHRNETKDLKYGIVLNSLMGCIVAKDCYGAG